MSVNIIISRVCQLLLLACLLWGLNMQGVMAQDEDPYGGEEPDMYAESEFSDPAYYMLEDAKQTYYKGVKAADDCRDADLAKHIKALEKLRDEFHHHIGLMEYKGAPRYVEGEVWTCYQQAKKYLEALEKKQKERKKKACGKPKKKPEISVGSDPLPKKPIYLPRGADGKPKVNLKLGEPYQGPKVNLPLGEEPKPEGEGKKLSEGEKQKKKVTRKGDTPKKATGTSTTPKPKINLKLGEPYQGPKVNLPLGEPAKTSQRVPSGSTGQQTATALHSPSTATALHSGQSCHQVLEGYKLEVKSMVSQGWKSPKPPHKGEWKTQLVYNLMPGGAIASVRLAKSSGHTPIDQSALGHVSKFNGTLPSLPGCLQGHPLEMHHTFRVIYK